MKQLLFAGLAAFVVGTPALAEPGNGHGNGQGKAQSAKSHGNAHANPNRAHVVTARSDNRLNALNGRGSCPPGLAKKNNGCQPPGQAKKMYNVGQRYNRNFGNAWTYNQIPADLRSRYDLNQNGRYYYRSGYVYQVDPRTMMVQQAISAVLR